jgi:hypothetical protein
MSLRARGDRTDQSDQFSLASFCLTGHAQAPVPARNGGRTMAAIIREEVLPCRKACRRRCVGLSSGCSQKTGDRYDSTGDRIAICGWLASGSPNDGRQPCAGSRRGSWHIPWFAPAYGRIPAGGPVARAACGSAQGDAVCVRSGSETMPAWSPKADRIAYAADANGCFRSSPGRWAFPLRHR